VSGSFLRRSSSDRGQSLVEFALVLPVFLLFVFGIIDGGRAILAYNQMSQATRNVARVASVTCFDTTTRCDETTAGSPVKNAIAAQAAGLQGPTTWTVDCIDPATNAPAATCEPGDIVRVTVASQVTMFTPIIAQALGSVNVASTSEATIIQ
jgi:Flp pilus assembly protein TadG